MKETQFRIFGTELDESDTFVDATVDGIDNDGRVYFAEVNGKRTWTLSPRRIKELTSENLMVKDSEIETHPLWERAEQLGDDQVNNAKTDFGNQNLGEAQRNVFLAAYFETR